MRNAARSLRAVAGVTVALVGVHDAEAAELARPALEEVIVTAERRETDLQDTPISIVSLGAEKIEQVGAQSLDNLQAYVPNLSITYSGPYGRGNPQFNIRGVGSGVLSAGAVTERPVGLYIDGVYFARSQGSLLSLTDAQRIDVLRGPQGTLFGRNTTGGAIAYTSRMPTSQFEGFAKVKVGDFSQREAQLMVNVPLTDKIFLRGMYADIQQDGYVKRGAIDLGDTDDRVARLQLRVQPSSAVTIDLSGTYSETRTNGDPRVPTQFDLAGLPVAAHFAALDFLLRNQGAPGLTHNDPRIVAGDYSVPALCILDDTNPFTFGPECETQLQAELTVGTSRIKWDISDDLSLTSISGYIAGDQSSSSDWVWTGAYYRPFSFDYKTLSQEFQLNWNTDRLKLVAGAIYFDEDAREREITTEITRSSAFALTEAQILAGQQVTRRDESYQSLVTSLGAFAQGTWSVTDRLGATIGLRYSRDEKDVTIRYRPAPNDPRDATGQGAETWSDVDWRLAVDYDISDDLMVYASVTDAYKAGIADDSSLEVRGNVNSTIAFIPPENALGYEVGARSEWLDSRLRVNVSLYRTNYSDRQSSQLIADPVSGILVQQSINLGDVSYQGIEGDLALAVTERLTLTGAFGVLEYDIDQAPQDVLADVPEHSWTVGAAYNVELGAVGSLAASVNYGRVAESYGTGGSRDPIEDPSQVVNPNYGLLSGRLQYTAASGGWSVALYGTNLLDEVYSTSATGQEFHMGLGGRAVRSEYRGRPRSLGIEARMNF
jgi:iron complex outermembrane receptor protein